MSATYKPGTVAEATVRGVPDVTVMRCGGTGTSGWDQTPFWWTAEYVGEWRNHADSDVTDVRPLAVLDAPQVDLNAAAEILRISGFSAIADQIKAQTKPPRIPEPGLWGVVEASSSLTGARRWVRHPGPSICWCDGFGNSAVWDSLIDPVLIREGVE